MMIARWQFLAKFGYKGTAIDLLKEWDREIGSQTNIDMGKQRVITGSVGASEALVEAEFEIADLAELQAFFDKIATVQMHEDWGRKMSEVIVSGSAKWDIYRVVE